MKNCLKLLLIFIMSFIIIYLLLTLSLFFKYCKLNNLYLFTNDTSDKIMNLDSSKIKELGDTIANYKNVLDSSLDSSYYENNSNYHSIAEYYDTLGLSVHDYMQQGLNYISTAYLNFSIILGISITIAYFIINSTLNTNIKFLCGYICIILIFPHILAFSYSHNLFNIIKAYYKTPNILHFYILYSISYILIYVLNYKKTNKKAK